MDQKISKKYAGNRDALAASFPGAYRFLLELENGAASGLWLSTSTNAHLYKQGAFLSYIRFGNLQYACPAIILSPDFHISIVRGTSDQSRLLFPEIVSTFVRNPAVPGSLWWSESSDGAFEFRSATPESVFQDLLDRLRTLEIETP